MATPFKHLFSPLQLGGKEVKNRIVVPPHGVTFAAGHGDAVERAISYHVEKAKGGAGMIVMSTYVTPPSWKEIGTWGGLLPKTPLGGMKAPKSP